MPSQKNKSRIPAKTRHVTAQRMYLYGALAVLLVSTILWATLGAKINMLNADQLVNTYLANNIETFRQASFPGSHSFLFKWPLFVAMRLLGATPLVFVIFTVLTAVSTVGILAYIMSRIEKRPLVLGTLFLGLASMLLLVPTQPYAGGLLPVNMAMVTTRNLEYALYIAALYLIARAGHFKTKSYAAAVVLLCVLFVSDRLFIGISLGGALLLVILYTVSRHWKYVSLAVNWLVATLIASIVSVLSIWLLAALRVTNFTNASAGSPYQLVTNIKNLSLGLLYAVAGLLTNFGANPAFDATTLRSIPNTAAQRLTAITGFGFVVNMSLVIIAVWCIVSLVRATIQHKRTHKNDVTTTSSQLSLMLIATTIAAVAAYIVTAHYYAVDARYLTIALFAVVIAVTTYISYRNPPDALLWGAGAIIGVGIVCGASFVVSNYRADQRALSIVHDRNQKIVEVLSSHSVDTLLGDYWRSIPIRSQSGNKQNITPLSDCTTPRDVLSSKQWQPDLNNHSFAYLLSYDQNLTDFPNCTYEQVVQAYGRPDSSVVIDGTVSAPKEQLLFYDQGIHRPKNTSASNTQSTVLPIPIDELVNVNCDGPTIMNVVAHQDDDLLFMSPDLLQDIKNERCVRTIYMTAGDAGKNRFYWLNRERGAEAAYSNMLASSVPWTERIVQLPGGQIVTIANPRGNTKVSLIFMHLPDGGLDGKGYDPTSHQTLAKLQRGTIPSIQAVYNDSRYTLQDVTATLVRLMQTYRPSEVRTQSTQAGKAHPDHGDHNVVGVITTQAKQQYQQKQYENEVVIPIKYYLGYTGRDKPQNVFGELLKQKEQAFNAYTSFDNVGCTTMEACDKMPTYGSYLKRQYIVDR